MLPILSAVGLLAAFAIFVMIAYRREWQWTGLPATQGVGGSAEDRPAKTLWDWLQLLGIPLALASLAFLLNEAQSSRTQRRDDQRAMQQRTIEDKRATEQRTIEDDAEQENTLRTYLSQMSDLMLDRGLPRSEAGADVREVARTATLTAVRRLDGPRRGLVIQFLAEAGLLLRRERDGDATVKVFSANFAHAALRRATLVREDFSGANLSGADLSEAQLFKAGLSFANLSGADLSGALSSKADLVKANVSGADLSRADLTGVDLTRANLSGANLRGAELSGANLRWADLTGANLSGARHVDMTGSSGKPAHAP